MTIHAGLFPGLHLIKGLDYRLEDWFVGCFFRAHYLLRTSTYVPTTPIWRHHQLEGWIVLVWVVRRGVGKDLPHDGLDR
jgi:hypothetical protein